MRWLAVVAGTTLLIGACSGSSSRVQTKQPSKKATPAAAADVAATDTEVCTSAFPKIADYSPTKVLRALDAPVSDVQSWLASRRESQGVAPDRSLKGLAANANVVVCVIAGSYAPPGPPPPPGETAPPVADAGRFLVLPNGQVVVDAMGPVQSMLNITPSSFHTP